MNPAEEVNDEALRHARGRVPRGRNALFVWSAAVGAVPIARVTSGWRSTISFADIRILSTSVAGPSNVHSQVAAFSPTQLQKPLREPGEPELCLGITQVKTVLEPNGTDYLI
jgi:hypothetical protein